MFPRTYPQMANSLLETVRMLDGEKGIDRLFRKRTETLAAQYRSRMANKNLEEKVKELAAIRSEEGYMADWQKINKNTFRLARKKLRYLSDRITMYTSLHFRIGFIS